jgi:hypothetical protein
LIVVVDQGEIWTVDFQERRRYREFRYREKRNEQSSNFVKCEVSICEREIWTIRSRGLWTIYLVSEKTS